MWILKATFQRLMKRLKSTLCVDGKEHRLVLRSSSSLGDDRVRTIAMDMSEGVVRGHRSQSYRFSY